MSLLIERDLSDALLEVNVFHYGPGSELGPHPDLPESSSPTSCTSTGPGTRRTAAACRSCAPGTRPTSSPGSVPLVGNSAVIVRSDDSWHAVDPVVADGRLSRRSVTVTFYGPDRSARCGRHGDPAPLIDYDGADLDAPEPRPVAVVLGTRPEAIKLAPVVAALERSDDVAPRRRSPPASTTTSSSRSTPSWTWRPSTTCGLFAPGQPLPTCWAAP